MIPIRLTGLPPHNTIARYSAGCRCGQCTAADIAGELDPELSEHLEAQRLNAWIADLRAAQS